MPAVAKTSAGALVTAARRIVERHGADALSMQAVADTAGVRAPSIYKRFVDRAALVVAVEREAFAELADTLERSGRRGPPAERLRLMAHAYRRWARAHPRLYGLMFSGATRGDDAATEARQRAAAPALAELVDLVGSARALPAARVLTSFLHGFVSMELAGEFRLGPGAEGAFRLGLELILTGWR